MNYKNSKQTVTISDVAKLAMVSEATVSRVINRKNGVSEQLLERVNNAIKDLNYKPNSFARALKNKSSKTLGLIIPSVENPTFALLVSHVEKTAQRYGFSIILCSSEGNINNEERYIEFLIDKQVDGILFDATGYYSDVLESLITSRMPTIVIGKKIHELPSSNVTVNNYQGAFAACEHLIKTGCRSIVFLSSQHDAKTAIDDRLNGYIDALRHYDIPFSDALIVNAEMSYQGAANKTKEMIESGIEFDAVFASNDVLAIGCMNMLIEYGVSIPEQVCIIGYDDIPFSTMTRPRLSSVSINIEMLARLSVKELLKIIYTGNDSQITRCLEPDLVLRDTTRCIG